MFVFLAGATRSVAHAQPARALASPWSGAAPSAEVPGSAPPETPLSVVPPIAPSTSPTEAVQDIHPTTAAQRRFGDGQGADVSWSDPELDLRPVGYLHGGLFGMAGVITGTSHTPISPDLAIGAFVDIALEPNLSLHLRLGAVVRARFGLAVVGADGMRGEQASVSGRALALIGAHFFQALALRIGFEVGGSAALGAPSGNSGAGWAAVVQLGVRVDDGHVEIVIDGAMDSHELVYSRPDGSGGRFSDQPSPRLLLGLIGEFG